MPIRFNLYRTKGTFASIRAVIHHKGQVFKMSTGIKVEIKDWDKKRECCKTNSKANRKIEAARETIQTAIDETGTPPLNIKKPHKKRTTITQAIQKHRRRKELESTSPHTWRAYSTLLSNLQRYHTDKNRKEKYLTDINTTYLDGFMHWLQKNNYSNCHASKMIKTLRAVIRKHLPPETWNEVKPPPEKTADQVYLTPEEIKLIENLQIPPESHLNRIRDYFLIGCYTGLRFSDWSKVGKSRMDEIGTVKIITITQQKTGFTITIPVSEKLLTIINKHPNGLTPITNQAINRQIKKIAQLAGITKTIAITEYRGGKTNQLTFKKYELISSHTARRSFATNAMMAGIPVTEIMKFTGHRSLSAFLKYIRTTDQEAAVNFANHPFFK